MKMNEIITEQQGLAKITTKSGKSTEVAAPVQAQFQAFLNDLEATGYNIYSLGGYNRRPTSSGKWSYHAQGLAIDINPDDNPHNKGPNAKLVTDMPPNISQIAAKHGLGWGGNWRSSKDAMHFSAAAREGGSIPIDRSPDIYGGPAARGGTAVPAAPETPTAGANRSRTSGAKFTNLQNTGTYNPAQSERVKKVQTLLQRLGYNVGDTGIDGKYGPRTERAVRRFQQDNGLRVDGIVGPETAKALTATKGRSPRGQLTNIQTQSQGGIQTGRQSSTANNIKAPQLSGTAMERATTLVKELEGYKPNAYPDYKQYSIGYGSKATGPNEVIDQAEAERRLRSELQAAFEHVTRVQRQGNYDWNDDQIAALMSFTYNLGNINQLTANGTRDDETIAAKMLLYRNVTKKGPDGKPIKVPLPGLVKRRKREAALFQSGMTNAA